MDFGTVRCVVVAAMADPVHVLLLREVVPLRDAPLGCHLAFQLLLVFLVQSVLRLNPLASVDYALESVAKDVRAE